MAMVFKATTRRRCRGQTDGGKVGAEAPGRGVAVRLEPDEHLVGGGAQDAGGQTVAAEDAQPRRVGRRTVVNGHVVVGAVPPVALLYVKVEPVEFDSVVRLHLFANRWVKNG